MFLLPAPAHEYDLARRRWADAYVNTLLAHFVNYLQNETGVITDIASIVRAVKSAFPEQCILFHTDASQAVGKIATRVSDLCVDMLTIAGHKLYAPKVRVFVFFPLPTRALHAHGRKLSLL